MKTKITIVAAIAILSSCATKQKTVQTFEKPMILPAVIEVTSENIVKGKSIYENNCGKCHQFYEPTEFKKERWKNIVNSMQRKARITDEETVLVYNYIVKDL